MQDRQLDTAESQELHTVYLTDLEVAMVRAMCRMHMHRFSLAFRVFNKLSRYVQS